MASSQNPEPTEAPGALAPFVLRVEDVAIDVAFHHEGGETDGIYYELDADGDSLTVTATRLADGARFEAQFDYAGPAK